MKKDKIADFLGIDPSTPPPNPVVVKDVTPKKENNDYEYARNNLYDILEKGHSALENIIDIAKQSESARAFEVATNLIKTMAETNKDLLNLTKVKKEIEKSDEPVEQQKVTNNNLFVGSSADLLKMIKGNSEN